MIPFIPVHDCYFSRSQHDSHLFFPHTTTMFAHNFFTDKKCTLQLCIHVPHKEQHVIPSSFWMLEMACDCMHPSSIVLQWKVGEGCLLTLQITDKLAKIKISSNETMGVWGTHVTETILTVVKIGLKNRQKRSLAKQ